MIESAEDKGRLLELVELKGNAAGHSEIATSMLRCKTVLSGHFALHRNRHAMNLFRFRGIGQDGPALAKVSDALIETAPASLVSAMRSTKVLAPESAGFFLGHAIAERTKAELVVTQTNLRRLPAKTLLSGSLNEGDRVVIINDVAGTGASLDALRELIAERHAFLTGVLLFGVVDEVPFQRYCARLDVPSHYLVTAKWRSYTPNGDCPGCASGQVLMPISELV